MMKLEFTKIEKLNAEIDDQIVEDLLHPGIAMLYGKENLFRRYFCKKWKQNFGHQGKIRRFYQK